MKTMTCVLRPVRGIDQYIPIADAAILKAGEKTFTGPFVTETEHDGPSRSHARTICLPRGEIKTGKLTSEMIRSLRN